MIDASDVQINLVEVFQVKDLGKWLTNSLTPTLQSQKATNKAKQVMGITRKSFKYFTKESFLLLHKSHTLSIASLAGVLFRQRH